MVNDPYLYVKSRLKEREHPDKGFYNHDGNVRQQLRTYEFRDDKGELIAGFQTKLPVNWSSRGYERVWSEEKQPYRVPAPPIVGETMIVTINALADQLGLRNKDKRELSETKEEASEIVAKRHPDGQNAVAQFCGKCWIKAVARRPKDYAEQAAVDGFFTYMLKQVQQDARNRLQSEETALPYIGKVQLVPAREQSPAVSGGSTPYQTLLF